MLAVSAARCAVDDAGEQRRAEEEAAASGVKTVATTDLDMDFDFTVDDIDFGDFFLRLEDGDALPDLEVDPAEIFTEFEAVAAGGGMEELRDQQVPCAELLAAMENVGSASPTGGGVENAAFAEAGDEKGECNNQADEDGNMGGDRAIVPDAKSPSSSSTEAESRHRSSGKTSHGKKKAKVDWTPDLHRRFVQAVEQLGIDKAVPSRILEIMGINSLTRHNIASHLQGIAPTQTWVPLLLFLLLPSTYGMLVLASSSQSNEGRGGGGQSCSVINFLQFCIFISCKEGSRVL